MITETELKLIAAAAIIGDNKIPKQDIKHQQQLEYLIHYRKMRKRDFV